MTRTVAVDLDGVVHKYSKGWHDGTIYDEPVDGAVEGLQALMKRFCVYIHTTRNELDTALYLQKYGFKVAVYDNVPGTDGLGIQLVYSRIRFWSDMGVLLVSNRKLPAIAFVDDRGVRFFTWEQTLAFFKIGNEHG